MKKENSTLQKKLASYSALAVSMIAAGNVSNAQVVYHDINPDKVLNTDKELQKIDLNNDGTQDFQVKYRVGASFVFGFALPYDSNSVAGSLVSFTSINHAFPYAFSSGAVINSNANFFNINSLLFSYNGQPSYIYYPLMGLAYGGAYYYNWQPGAGDQYLGVRLNDGTDQYYGWVRCEFNVDLTTLTVKDWGWQSTVNTGLNAGEGLNVGIADVNNASNISIYSFEKTINVSTPATAGEMNVVVSDLLGKSLINQTTNESNLNINASDLATGVYFVTVTKGGEVKTNKVSIR
ncbi:MAG: T9SS type A sorting domain-containing protein [Chitinophagales bacterium]|nr:T9SS type A sorting domain-containing protein [Chitinophagales bacterium]